MSNWEPEEVSDADMEDVAGGAGKYTDADKKKMKSKKPNDGSDPFPAPGGGKDEKDEKRPPYKK